jgi:hypothetical protein
VKTSYLTYLKIDIVEMGLTICLLAVPKYGIAFVRKKGENWEKKENTGYGICSLHVSASACKMYTKTIAIS